MVLPGKSIDGLVEDTGAERISTQGDPRDRGGQEVPRQGGDLAAEGGYCIVGSRIGRNGDLMVAGGLSTVQHYCKSITNNRIPF